MALFLRTILILRKSLFFLVFPWLAAAPAGAQGGDSLAVTRRVVAAATLAAKEYGLGVAPRGGRIVLPEEVDEARLFVDQARLDVPGLPSAVRAAADSQLRSLRGLLERLAPPERVSQAATELVRTLAAGAGGPIAPVPARPPSLARGAQVYRQHCATCHGDEGRGDGPAAAALAGPPPADLTDPATMVAAPPAELYDKISIGVPATAMPAFEAALSADDRWAVTAYLATLWTTARASNGAAEAAAIFDLVRRQVDSAITTRSDRLAFDAYLTFEGIETTVRARDAALARELERDFAILRARVGTASPAAGDSLRRTLYAGLERAERAVGDRVSSANLFIQSFVLLLREGFEAILIVAALMTFLTKSGAPHRRRELAYGAWLAVAASLVTWAVVELVFQWSAVHREALEGFTMLLATVVLFYVSYWLVSKIEVARWTSFVKGRMEEAVSTGSGLALGAVAFLAVYREGFETILFYKALFTSADGGGTAMILAGMAVGAVALVIAYVAVNRFGLRLPLKPFFAATSALLYYMAFVFAGKGIAELQEAGLVGITWLEGWPRVAALGIYPTLESVSLQATLLLLALVALAWVRRRPAVAA